MMNEKIDLKIKQDLFSANPETVILAINSIKSKGNKLYLPMLFDLLNSNPGREIELEITRLLGTVKDKEAINSFMRTIEDDNYKAIRKTLLVSCWQNGLDFSTFLPVFIDLVISGDWEIAFEAFTIIDNLEFLPNPKIIESSISKINQTIESATDQKQYFLREILVKIS